ncbi:MAG: nucleoside triphosphate pyrophosphohydrolase [Colwellia sp.]|nr:nucleoside triphosphate pyrophosphohydrolase [Colwellia sp.]
MLNNKPSIEKLRWIMSELRNPETGCPWDIKQDFASIVKCTIEEAYEVADAIEQQDFVELEKELGDLLFQVIFYSQLGQEQQSFDFDSVVAAICEKLIRRHPHVFGSATLNSDAEIKANWENEKIKERQAKNKAEKISILADIPKNLPALSQAAKIQKRCAHVGFDWHNIDDVFDKVVEEVDEVKAEIELLQEGKPQALAEELGDLMFAVVNLCRHAKQDPETLLRQANRKFTKRFHGVEQHVEQSGISFEQHELSTLEDYWQQIKIAERKR